MPPSHSGTDLFFFLITRPPPTSTLFPTRRSSDLAKELAGFGVRAFTWTPTEGLPPADAFEGVDTIFHLAGDPVAEDRKSTRLNSSHPSISYAVFCLKKKIYGWLSPAMYCGYCVC